MKNVSVVVPTYRRPDLLERCLRALLGQDYSRDSYEILVCDDGAETGAAAATQKLVDDLAKRARVELRYVPVRGRHGPAAARNTGWRKAKGSVIAFTDDDTIPDGDWLASGVRHFEHDATVAVWGRTVVPLPENPTDYEKDTAGLATAEFVTANCFVRKEALLKIGGFDETFTMAWREDSDLHFRLLPLGAIQHAPAAVVVHPIRPAPWGVSLKQVKKAFFNALLYKKHPALYRKKIQPHPPYHYYGMVLSLIGAGAAFAAGLASLGSAFVVLWLLLAGRFTLKRLRGTSRRLTHVTEMAVTSALIPPLAVFWRLYGAYRFRVVFV